MTMPLPDIFVHNCLGMFGASGESWIAQLPELLASLEQRWQIRVLPPFALSYNYVAPAVRASGEQVVLKVYHPNPELLSEMTALELYGGRATIRLLEMDVDRGAMLLERAEPGMPLVEMADDDEATRIAARMMQKLWIPAPENAAGVFPTTQKWGKGFERLRATFGGGTGPYAPRVVERAERVFAALEASTAAPVLLHGDLHHWNIISAQREPWLIIDPKGVIGEPAYEPGALLRNPYPDLPGAAELVRRLPRRLDILHEMLGLDRERMLAWSMAQAMLSAWWSYEDTRDIAEAMMYFAAAQEEMLPRIYE